MGLYICELLFFIFRNTRLLCFSVVITGKYVMCLFPLKMHALSPDDFLYDLCHVSAWFFLQGISTDTTLWMVSLIFCGHYILHSSHLILLKIKGTIAAHQL